MKTQPFSQWRDLLSGRIHGAPVDQVVFNLTTLLSGTFLFTISLISLIINPAITAVWFTFLSAAILFTGYYLGRFKNKWQKVGYIVALTSVLFATLAWAFGDRLFGSLPVTPMILILFSLVFLPCKKCIPFLLLTASLALLLSFGVLPELSFDLSSFSFLDPIPMSMIWGCAGIFCLGSVVHLLKTHYEKERSKVLQKNEELSNFAHRVSHDMKAPLRGIQYLSQFVLADNEEKLDLASVDMLKKVISSSDKMTVLINDLLTYSRLSDTEGTKEFIDMNNLVQEIVELLNPSSEVVIRYSGLPQQVYYHRIALHQVIQNLISNAIKYNDKSNPIIEITANLQGEFYWVGVKDNGPGIAEEHHETIFEFLKTLGTPSRAETGTGIGLALVKKIIEQNAGKIRLDSVLGTGTTFWVSIPVNQ